LNKPHVFDLHGGGLDLIFPHHENEIAQSRCAHGTPVMANVWLHNGFLQVEGEKMSKSLGNFVTIHELLTGWRKLKWPGQVIRLAMLSTHYRQPIDFSLNALEQASIALTYFKSMSFTTEGVQPSTEFMAALEDDLNTPRAIAELHRLYNVAKKRSELTAEQMTGGVARMDNETYQANEQLAAALSFIGIDIESYDQNWVQTQMAQARTDIDHVKVEEAIAARLEARKRKDFAESDRIRDELAKMGIALKDTKNKETGEVETTWEVAR
jgi:cysteinyl-tRNA synthetase